MAGTEAGVDSNTETHSEGIDAGLPLDAKRYAEPPTLPAEPSSDQEPALVAAPSSQAGQRVWRGIARAAVLALVLGAAALGFQILARPSDPLDSFWRPVFSSSSPILLCVGNVEGGRRATPGGVDGTKLTLRDYHGMDSQIVLVDDATTLSRFAGLLQAKGKSYRVASQSSATFADFQNSPAVLIGLLNNDWTERLVSKLRFSVERPAPGRVVLLDREHPERNDWSIDYSTPYLDVTKDYALVFRVLDPQTEQMVVAAAGITVFGTLAAGEFLTSPQEFRKIEAVAPKGWRKMNFELVLSTDVIRGKSGHPNIVASYFW